MQIKISKSQWNQIGMTAGWMKTAQEGTSVQRPTLERLPPATTAADRVHRLQKDRYDTNETYQVARRGAQLAYNDADAANAAAHAAAIRGELREDGIFRHEIPNHAGFEASKFAYDGAYKAAIAGGASEKDAREVAKKADSAIYRATFDVIQAAYDNAYRVTRDKAVRARRTAAEAAERASAIRADADKAIAEKGPGPGTDASPN